MWCLVVLLLILDAYYVEDHLEWGWVNDRKYGYYKASNFHKKASPGINIKEL